jgi:SanA protein
MFLKIKKNFKKIIYLSLIVCILTALINYFIKTETNPLISTTADEIPKTKVGIIFGAGIKGNKPSKYLKDRLDAGIRLYKLKKINKILLSGDNGNDAHDELTVMKTYCFEKGVDTTKIYLDYAGFDTYSTLYRAKHIFKINKAVLISQEYHLNRAIYLGNHLGVESIGFSANKGEYQNYYYVCFREFFSRVKAFIDYKLNREPHFLGRQIDIDGVSNYSKEDKR